ncbi:MAG: hypothetical protein OEZ02_12455 [Anaerolineae bacterium]|nr:hypothetical protein [Anaerolineae bacterium]
MNQSIKMAFSLLLLGLVILLIFPIGLAGASNLQQTVPTAPPGGVPTLAPTPTGMSSPLQAPLPQPLDLSGIGLVCCLVVLVVLGMLMLRKKRKTTSS